MTGVSYGYVGAIYEHYSGKRYKVLAVGRLTESETLEECVVYQGLYDDPQFGNNPIWIRPLSMFLQEIEIRGKLMPRFRNIDKTVDI